MAKSGEHQVPPVEIDAWRGMFSNVSPQAIPAGGTQKQINVASFSPGILETRAGARDVSFEN